MPGPMARAESKELSEAVEAVIARLPDVYRPVLRLHLRKGLSTQAIAIALERSPGTVRSQLFRGMAMLRRALPASFIAGTVVLTTPAHGIAAIREVVLSKAATVT